MDVLSRLTLKGNPDFFEDSVASIREAFGLDEEEEPAPAEPLGKPVTTPPPPPAPPTPIEEAEGYLLDRFAKGTISKSRLIGFGGSLIRQAYTNLSATMSIPSGTKSNLWEAASNSPWMTPGFNMGMGMTLKAAHGFDGIVRRPTTILAGEAGPERVNIQPTDAGRGGMGSKQIFVTFNINALDGASVDETVERKVVPRLIRALRDASERGVDIIHDRGIIREVAV